MNFRNNRGYTGIDISVAMIIILIFIPTIFGIVYNIQRINGRAERQSNAVNIATDILEIAKSLNYNDVNISDSGLLKTQLENKYTSSSQNAEIDVLENEYEYLYFTYVGENEVHYRIQVGILKYFPEGIEKTDENDLVKKIKVTVTYPVGKNTKKVEISTVLQKNS